MQPTINSFEKLWSLISFIFLVTELIVRKDEVSKLRARDIEEHAKLLETSIVSKPECEWDKYQQHVYEIQLVDEEGGLIGTRNVSLNVQFAGEAASIVFPKIWRGVHAVDGPKGM